MSSNTGTAGRTGLDAGTRKNLAASIAACLLNGQRLIDESYDLEFREPPASQYYLIMIAQEEFAKAFLLYLVREGAAPFSPAVRRAIKDHVCKQLLGIVLDYMIMHWDEISELEAAIKEDSDLGDDQFPNDVGSALEILCYEKIGRWGDEKYWSWAEDPAYDPSVLQIAAGKKDQRKQDALYVQIGGDGRPCQTSPITTAELKAELDRAGRYKRFIEDAAEGSQASHRFLKVQQAFRSLLIRAKKPRPDLPM